MAVCHVGATWVVQRPSMGSVYLASRVECTQYTAKERSWAHAFDLGPWASKSLLPRLVRTSKAIANKANMRDQALLCAIRAFAKPSHPLVSRKPSSQPKR